MKNLEKQKIIDDLKLKCSAFINYYTEKKDIGKFNIYKHIEAILKIENAFDKIDGVVAINIITDLVKDKTKAKQIYLELLSK